MANNDFVEVVSEQGYKNLQKYVALVEQAEAAVKRINSLNASSKTASTPSANNSVTQSSNSAIQQNINLRKRAVKAIFDEEKARQSLERQKQKSLATDQKEIARYNAAQSIYLKVQQKLNLLNSEYRNLATRKELFNNLTDKEAKRYDYLSTRIQRYDKTLKAVDASMGKYQRNVGNYASGFNPLSNSINQLTREAPAFANSIQTGFLAISNNLPIFFDAIQQTNAQIKELRAQGQQVPGLFKQLTSSLLGWGTALSVGVTLLTFYGDEIVDWASDLFKSTKAIDAVKTSQEQLNSIRQEAGKAVLDERVQLQAWLATAADVNLSLTEREIAANKVLDTYPYFFQALGKEAILNGQVAEAVEKVNTALLARARSNAALGKIEENQAKILVLEEERYQLNNRLNSARLKAEKDFQNLVNRRNSKTDATGFASADSYREVDNLQKKLIDNGKQTNAIQEVNNRLIKSVIDDTKTSIGLDYQKSASTEEITQKIKDYYASEYELNQARLESDKQIYTDLYNNSLEYYEARQKFSEEIAAIEIKQAELRRRETIRLAEQETEDEISEINKRVNERKLSKVRADAVILSYEKDLTNKIGLAWEEYYAEFYKLTNDSEQRTLDLRKKYFDEFTAYREKYKDEGLNLGGQEDDVKAFWEEQEKAAKSYLDTLERLKKTSGDYLSKFTEQVFKDVGAETLFKVLSGDIELFGKNYKKEFEQLEYYKKLGLVTGEEYKKRLNEIKQLQIQSTVASINTLVDVFQEAYNFLQTFNNQKYNAQYTQLEREKELALSFAADTEEARAEVERQYDERRREIRRKELQAQKEQAIFNAVINTAQAVVAALATGPQGIALAAIVGALGAAQIALIASQQIPAYKMGTDNHKGGLAIVGDGGKKELIWQPSSGFSVSPDKDTLVNLEKGSKVFPDLSKLDLIGGRLPNMVMGGSGMSKADMIDALSGTIGAMPKADIRIDEHGFTKRIVKGNTAQKILNNSATFRNVLH